MIQRKQSLFLLASAIVTLILLFIPIATLTTEIAIFDYSAFTVKRIVSLEKTATLSTVYVALSLIISAICSVVAIFTYKNRKKQQRVVSVNMLLILITIFVMTYVYPEMVFTKHVDLQGAEMKYNVWIFLIFIPAISLFLAKKAIAKDEALVNSSDRLR